MSKWTCGVVDGRTSPVERATPCVNDYEPVSQQVGMGAQTHLLLLKTHNPEYLLSAKPPGMLPSWATRAPDGSNRLVVC